jgi:hypothetical protein
MGVARQWRILWLKREDEYYDYEHDTNVRESFSLSALQRILFFFRCKIHWVGYGYYQS